MFIENFIKNIKKFLKGIVFAITIANPFASAIILIVNWGEVTVNGNPFIHFNCKHNLIVSIILLIFGLIVGLTLEKTLDDINRESVPSSAISFSVFIIPMLLFLMFSSGFNFIILILVFVSILTLIFWILRFNSDIKL